MLSRTHRRDGKACAGVKRESEAHMDTLSHDAQARDTLAQQHCDPWRTGELPIAGKRLLELHRLVPDWHVIEHAGLTHLQRTYTFDTFAEALAFTDKVGRLAHAEEHFPTIVTEWGKVRVSWWTRPINGLHRNDFIMALKTDRLYQRAPVIIH